LRKKGEREEKKRKTFPGPMGFVPPKEKGKGRGEKSLDSAQPRQRVEKEKKKKKQRKGGRPYDVEEDEKKKERGKGEPFRAIEFQRERTWWNRICSNKEKKKKGGSVTDTT